MKRIKVKVIPNAGSNHVTLDGNRLKVKVKSPAVKGKANKELIALLTEFYNVKKGSIRIVKGERSRDKIIEVDDKHES